jgi:hypothetical protein
MNNEVRAMQTFKTLKSGNSLKSQRGLGILAMLTIGVMVGFFVLSGIRIAPGYFEYQTVKELLIEAAEDFDDEQDTISDIRRSLAGSFNMNQVQALSSRDVKVSRENGKVMINGNYEHRIPLFWRIDAVVKYDDLIFEAGTIYSDK